MVLPAGSGRGVGRLLTLGPMLLFSVLLGYWLGNKADVFFGTSPALAMFGVALGIGAAALELVQVLRILNEDSGKKRRGARPSANAS